MIRVLIYLLLLAALAAGFAWFAENPGQLTIDWPGYEINVTLFWFTVAIVIAAGILFFIASLIARLIAAPRRLRRHLKDRRRTRGYAALRHGIFAVGAGDEAVAARYAIEARRTLSNEPLTALLQAQSAQLSGDHRTAQRVFEALSENPETRLLGLRGLFLEASREGQLEPARQYAARAMALNPALPWPVHALFNMQCSGRDWHGALETLSVARNHRHIDRKTYDRRRAVLLTAQAQELEETEAASAVDLALEAHRLAPDFVPAAVIAGRILASQGNMNKAARVLARTWQYSPHPELALNYAYARPGDSPRDRLARIKSLIVMTPDDPEARVALATAAIDARDWEEARVALEPLIAKNPTARVCALMARIEGGEKRDAGRVREWLARAARAPRDAVWMADGVISGEWQPVSPVTGALDAFEWRRPPEEAKTPAADPLFDEISALSQELEAVTRQIDDAKLAGEDHAVKEAGKPLTIIATAEQDPAQAEPAETSGAEKADMSAATAESRSARAAAPSGQTAVIVKPPVEGDVAATAEGKSEAGDQLESEKVASAAATPDVATEPTPAALAARKASPKIFVPERPPDDPGPETGDFEEPSTPYPRYRSH
jgi:HemY protein